MRRALRDIAQRPADGLQTRFLCSFCDGDTEHAVESEERGKTMGAYLRKQGKLLCCGLAAVIMLAACSSLPQAPVDAASPNYQYLIGPQDKINVIVWRNPELSFVGPVRPDGKISIPLVNDLPAVGRTSTQLSADIERALSRYIRDPVVTVVVTAFSGPYDQQIRVIGQAAHPQAVPYRQGMTLLDVMIAVGGLTDFASGNRAVLVRGSEHDKSYHVRLNDLIKHGDITANVDVLPGDILIIPQSWF